MRIALFTNITGDFIAKDFSDVYLPDGFDTWQTAVFHDDWDADAVVVLLYGSDKTESWLESLRKLKENRSMPVFVSTIDDPVRNVSWVNELKKLGVYILNINRIIYKMGTDAFYDKRMWYVASYPYSYEGTKLLVECIKKNLSKLTAPVKKCMAVDFDNTLWGGVIGEGDIVLSEHGIGGCYKDIQRALKQMKDKGVLLVALSKNNWDDVLPAFTRPDMVLQKEDFVEFRVNWESKAKNLEDVAKALNLGVESFMFLDDNPVERELMAKALPEVGIVPFTELHDMPSLLSDIYDTYFSNTFTEEDLHRTEMYHARKQRLEETVKYTNEEDMLRDFHITINLSKMQDDEKPRVIQLLSKTHQFNSRSSDNELRNPAAMLSQKDIFVIRVRDKFGDEGLVGVLLVSYDNHKAVIEQFVLSCRVMCRRIEYEVMSCLKEYFRQNGIEFVFIKYDETKKNGPVKVFLEKLGCNRVSDDTYSIKTKDVGNSTGIFNVVTAL